MKTLKLTVDREIGLWRIVHIYKELTKYAKGFPMLDGIDKTDSVDVYFPVDDSFTLDSLPWHLKEKAGFVKKRELLNY